MTFFIYFFVCEPTNFNLDQWHNCASHVCVSKLVSFQKAADCLRSRSHPSLSDWGLHSHHYSWITFQVCNYSSEQIWCLTLWGTNVVFSWTSKQTETTRELFIVPPTTTPLPFWCLWENLMRLVTKSSNICWSFSVCLCRGFGVQSQPRRPPASVAWIDPGLFSSAGILLQS